MSKLLLVRHGDTDLDSAQRYWGSTDVELSAAGFRQAERLRDRLATEKIDAVYSSDLKRAMVTAEIIASRHQLPVITCSELREINFGDVEGLTFEEIGQLYPELVKSWVQRAQNFRFPSGESSDELSNRVGKFADRLREHAEQDTILVTAHSGVLRTLMCQLLGVEKKFRWQMRLELASLSILEIYPETAVITLLNDTSHLR